MQLLIPIIILAACWSAPFPLMVVLFFIDLLIPDPIPVIDEILMIIIFFNRLKKVLFIQDFIRKHKIMAGAFLVLAIMGMFTLISWLIGVLGIR